jgi:hypothetical protein
VEHLVGYAKRDLIVPAEPDVTELAVANAAAAAWCEEVNAAVHSEICAVPAGRLDAERALLGPLPSLPSLRPELGPCPASRKAGKLSCVRFGSARYSVPSRLIGATVLITVGVLAPETTPTTSTPTTSTPTTSTPTTTTSTTTTPAAPAVP